MWFFGLSAINLLWNFHKSMLDRCLCLGLTGNRLVIFEIFLEQLQNLVFSTFFHISFLHLLLFLSIFCFLFFVSEVLILSLEVCRLILHLLMVFDIAKCRIFIMLFFLIFFAQNAHFFLIVGHRFFICKMWNKMFGETKKSFIILWFYFCFDSFLNFTILEVKKRLNFRIFLWFFRIFFILFRFLNLMFRGRFLFFGGILFCV